MLEQIFLWILNMSLTASWVILCVLAARMLLKKMPRIFSYALWSAVLFRLICPFSFQSIFSFLLVNPNPIPQNIAYQAHPQIQTGFAVLDQAVSAALPAPTAGASVNPMQVWTFLGSVVWLLGIAILLGYSLVSLYRLRGRLCGAVCREDGVFVSAKIDTPFVMGVFRPKIYLPATLTEKEQEYILLHERTHIRRLDPAVKILSFFVLCLHWFNPLVWIAFFLSGKDMEMSCDESVIIKLGADIKKDYSTSLLSLSTGRKIVSGTPLAFGEGDTKSRIKNVLHYKKPALWVLVILSIAIVAVMIALLSNPKKDQPNAESQDALTQSVTFPAYDSEKTEDNRAIFEIQPFTLTVQLPTGWTFGEKQEQFPLIGLWSAVGIYDENDQYVGAVGYNTYEEYEGAEDVPQAIYGQIALGNDYQFNAQPTEREGGAYTPVVTTDSGVTATTLVYYAAALSKEYGGAEEERYNKGILSYNKDLLTYVAFEFDDESLSEEEELAIAQSIRLTAGQSAPNTDLDQAVSQAILKQNMSKYHPGDFACESHVTLASEAGGWAKNSGEKTKTITVYTMAMYQEFQFADGGMTSISGSNIPTALTFSVGEDGAYTLQEYWIPRSGENIYASDLKAKFPEGSDWALDTQRYALAQTQSCYAQAIAYGSVDANAVIQRLLQTITSSPVVQSNPGDYIEAHQTQYRELLYYGDYTLRYCAAQFQKGGQTDLDGHILALVCQELLGEENREVSYDQGQGWYDSFSSLIQTLRDQKGEAYVKENLPKSYLLVLSKG